MAKERDGVVGGGGALGMMKLLISTKIVAEIEKKVPPFFCFFPENRYFCTEIVALVS